MRAPFNIACGECVFCKQQMYGNCHESNWKPTAVGAVYDYLHPAGDYGRQAAYGTYLPDQNSRWVGRFQQSLVL